MPRVSKGADVVSATSGLGGIFGFEVVCRGSLGTGSFAGILECGVLSLGGMLVVCLGADLDSDTPVLAVVLGLGCGRRVRCTLGATVAGTSVLRALGSRSVAATGLVRGVSGVGVV